MFSCSCKWCWYEMMINHPLSMATCGIGEPMKMFGREHGPAGAMVGREERGR